MNGQQQEFNNNDPTIIPTNQKRRYPARCYLAGPMRGLPGYNYPAFHKAARQLREMGWYVYSPAEMDVAFDGEDYQTFSSERQKLHDTAFNARNFARRDLDVILNKLRAEDGDVIIVLPNWENSIGASAEVAAGRWVFLPILTLEEALVA